MWYPCDAFFIFIIIFTMINLMNTDTFVLDLYFLECVLLFLDDNVMKNVNNFKIAKVWFQGVF